MNKHDREIAKIALQKALKKAKELRPELAENSALAALLGKNINHRTVSQWKERGRVASTSAISVSLATGVKLSELRPDMCPQEVELKEPA